MPHKRISPASAVQWAQASAAPILNISERLCGASPDALAFVRANARYVVLAGKVNRDLGYMKEDADGLAIGNGTITVSTEDGDINPVLMPSRCVHESAHLEYENARHKNGGHVFMLYTEMAAMSKELETVEEQLGNERGENERNALSNAQSGISARLKVAEFLSDKRFHGAFADVYPKGPITSQELVAAKVDPKAFAGILANKPTIPDLYEELYYAAFAANIALSRPRKEAITELYKIVSAGGLGNLQIINALYALKYLASDSMEIEAHSSGFDTLTYFAYPKGKTLEEQGFWSNPKLDITDYDDETHMVEIGRLDRRLVQIAQMYQIHCALPSLERLLANK